eukprot:1088731-Pelagomonas_calceolata.AAC.3
MSSACRGNQSVAENARAVLLKGGWSLTCYECQMEGSQLNALVLCASSALMARTLLAVTRTCGGKRELDKHGRSLWTCMWLLDQNGVSFRFSGNKPVWIGVKVEERKFDEDTANWSQWKSEG